MPAISDPSEDPITYPDLEPDPDEGGLESGVLGVGDVGGEEGHSGGGGGGLSHDHDGFDIAQLRTLMWNRFMEQSTVIVNATDDDQKVLRCFEQFVASLMEPDDAAMAGACPVKFDGVSCWPQTPPGTLRVIPCFDVFNGVYYDPSGEY